MVQMLSVAQSVPKSSEKARAAIYAASIGNMLEWYDFGVYAFLAGIISVKFFPSEDPTASLLATFAAYGVGFLARPLGAVLIGRMGDTKGRKISLILTLTMMAFGTIGLGVLPSYDQIGILAPILLVVLRIVQGIAAGGEWGVSTTFIIEWADQDRRGFVGSFQQVSTASGTLLGSAVAALLASTLADDVMREWGWRIPFLLGAAILVVGLFIRRNVDETPAFERSEERDDEPAASGPRLGARAFCFTIFWTVAYYTLLTYMPTFTQKFGGLSSSEALWSNTIGLVAMVLAIPLFGHLSDRFGRKPFLLASAICAAIFAYPLFSVVASKPGFAIIVSVQIAFGLIMALYSGPGPAAISEIFPSHLRSTWMSIGYTLAAAVFGGFAPFIATWLIKTTQSPLSPAYGYLIPVALISLCVLLTMSETAKSKLK